MEDEREVRDTFSLWGLVVTRHVFDAFKPENTEINPQKTTDLILGGFCNESNL
jgi:hypothetical protein